MLTTFSRISFSVALTTRRRSLHVVGEVVRLDHADDDVAFQVALGARRFEHPVGLADSRSGLVRRVQCQVQLEHVHGRFADEAEGRAFGEAIDERPKLVLCDPARFGYAVDLIVGGCG
jgi:hypothetical protein